MPRGTATESLVLAVNMVYQAKRIGRIVKREPATKHSKRGIIYTAKGTPDFSGHWRGLGFEMEVKEVARGDRFKFNNLITLRMQILDLETTAFTGGLAFLLVHFCDVTKGLREAYLVRIETAGNGRSRSSCPLLAWAHGLPVKPIKIEWFREHGERVPEVDGGLSWGRAIDAILARQKTA